MFAYLFLEICLRNFADFSFDSVLRPRPSDSLKLSSRLHEKQVFVKSLLRNFIKNSCWNGINYQESINKFIKTVSKIEFEIQHRISMLSVLILIPFWNRFGTVLDAKISFGGILGASWKPWEHLGSTSGQSWGMLGMRGGIVAASWQHLGTILGAFWMPWEHPRSTL